MKIKVIVNSESKRKWLDQIERLLHNNLAHDRIDVAWTEYRGHAVEIAAQAAAEAYDTVVAVGGDGTINEVLNGLRGSGAALGIIPAGTANDLASYYGISNRVEIACNIIHERCLHRTDIISVNGWHYLTVGGLGIPCDVIARSQRIKETPIWRRLLTHIMKSKLYVLAALPLPRSKQASGRIFVRTEGRVFNIDDPTLIIFNQPKLGKYFTVAAGAGRGDGRCDILLMSGSHSIVRFLRMMAAALTGTLAASPLVMQFRSGEITIDCAVPQPFFADGELSPEGSLFRIHVLPKAATIIVPRNRKGK